MARFTTVLSLLVLFSSVGAYAQDQEAVLVRHQETLDSNNVVASKQQAKQKALVQGLMQASQRMANPTLYQNNRALLESKFSLQPTAYVQDYQFIEQKIQADQYIFTLQVDPKDFFLKNKLADWGFMGFRSKPKVQVPAFLMNQDNPQGITASGDYWSSKVNRYLSSMGMSVVPIQSKDIAHFFIQSKILTSSKDEVEFMYQIANADKSFQQQHSFVVSNAKDENEMAGLLALDMIEHVMPVWFETQGNQRVYEVKLQNISQYELLNSFEKVLEQQRGIIQSVQDKRYMKGATVFEVRVLQESLHFPSFLSNLVVDGKSIHVIGQSGRQVIVEIH